MAKKRKRIYTNNTIEAIEAMEKKLGIHHCGDREIEEIIREECRKAQERLIGRIAKLIVKRLGFRKKT